MAQTTCPHCQSHSFEIQETSPTGAAYKQFFVQCSECGSPFSTLPYFEPTVMLQRVENRLKKIEEKLGI